MDKYLITGILGKKGENTFVIVVDCRVSKEWNDIPFREVSIYFSHCLKSIKFLEGEEIKENGAKFNLKPGEGQILELIK